MKKLNQFLKFDFTAWCKGKKFMITGVRYNDRRNCVSLDVAITEDHSDYGDKTISNVYEKFKVHCIQDTSEDDVNKYIVGQTIIFKNFGKCSVYGSYNEQLSVEAVVEVAK